MAHRPGRGRSARRRLRSPGAKSPSGPLGCGGAAEDAAPAARRRPGSAWARACGLPGATSGTPSPPAPPASPTGSPSRARDTASMREGRARHGGIGGRRSAGNGEGSTRRLRGKPARTRSSRSWASRPWARRVRAQRRRERLELALEGSSVMVASRSLMAGLPQLRKGPMQLGASVGLRGAEHTGDLGVGEPAHELERHQVALARIEAGQGRADDLALDAPARRASCAGPPRRSFDLASIGAACACGARSSSRAALRAMPNSHASGLPRAARKLRRRRYARS